MSGLTYFSKSGFSINEGGRLFNMHISWVRAVGFYFYLFGNRLYWFKRIP